ncbi:MAG: DNA cytosine methyltransferase [Gammaproteobacteria bacterium]|nr:DNA cytosine methyltransferase [Gammaproteobacteria bacterium]MCY4255521.1 DNA cytosine methyltransferase [Gammaproteobacteria bacterium]
MFSFYEFFAGGGMVRMGLGPRWSCLFANDFDQKKAQIYRRNWDGDVLDTRDVREVKAADLPGYADLAWGSFPCQDLSLAGSGAGLDGHRSGTFWPFLSLVEALIDQGRAPKVIALENVCGTLTSNGGRDFAAICSAFRLADYRYGAVVIDAACFLPQSRPRLFFLALRSDLDLAPFMSDAASSPLWYTKALQNAYEKLDDHLRTNWIWWPIPEPRVRKGRLEHLIEDNPASVTWHTSKETRYLLSMMSEVNLLKIEKAKQAGRRTVGTIYKRTRLDPQGKKAQRAEVRFDGLSGCLRTPAGGSSRQLVIVVEGDNVRTRLISSRETARLMGLPDDYELPENYNEAYHLTGDGVVVPAVRHLAKHVFEPILRHADRQMREAA